LCEEMGLAHTFVPVSFPPDRSYRALNPFGTVPFLQDGHVSMSESVAMMFYIARNTDQPRPCRRWPTSALRTKRYGEGVAQPELLGTAFKTALHLAAKSGSSHVSAFLVASEN
jgi:glutathione S-transferase